MCDTLNHSVSGATVLPMIKARLLTAVICVLGMACFVQAGLPDGLVAYYRFNAGSGLTVADETGAHNGTLTGALNWVEGLEGTALQFRGGNGSPFVNLGAWQTNGPAGLSLSLWVRWAGPNSLYQGLISQRDGTMYWWSELSTDAGQLRFKSNTSPQSNLYLTTPHLVQNEWTHVAFSHDAATSRGTVYLNGEQKLAGAWSLPAGNFANLRTGIGVVNTADGLGTFNGAIDETMIFQVPLSATDVQAAMKGYSEPVASSPSPANGQSDVPVDVVLAWMAGELAAAHDVYFGTGPDDVTAAGRTDPRGVLGSRGQEATTYDPEGLLEFGQTYYWRVDEVNAAPDNTIFKGETWSFTTEPFAYPIRNITATASSAQAGMGPENTVNGSGLDDNDQHSTDVKQTWLSAGVQPNWIQYEFDQDYKLHELWVWNSNQVIEPFVGFGARGVAIEHSTDGTTWTALEGVPEFAQATGAPTYTANTIVSFSGVTAKYVRLTIQSNWGSAPQTGLSEVRFFHIPVRARGPQPADGATGVSVDTVLEWRPGREATSHQIYLGTVREAVADGSALVTTLAEHTYEPAPLSFGTTYYWRVDEVGDAGTHEGEIWSFTTEEYMIVEDFESYTDDQGSRIYETWIDGYTNGNSGSTVGYFEAPFAEQTIVHSGRQSMPVEYNNVDPPFYSEAEREFSPVQDWTVNGADTLSLYFRGHPVAFLQRMDGTIVMGAGGADIWGTADQFRFAYKTLSGNGSIVARVDSMVAANAWTKVGVMIRETLEAGSKHVSVVVTPNNGVSFLNRPTTGAASVQVNQTGLQAPYWVKLTRTGDTFTAQRSADGVAWTNITADPAASTVTVAMSASVYIGLAVTSHNTSMQTSAEFSNVATMGTVTGPWRHLAIGIAQPSNDPAPLYVMLEDKASRRKMVVHPDPEAVTQTDWQQWQVPLSAFSSAGVNVAAVKKMYLGVGNPDQPTPGAAGLLFIDDIGVGHPAPGQ